MVAVEEGKKRFYFSLDLWEGLTMSSLDLGLLRRLICSLKILLLLVLVGFLL